MKFVVLETSAIGLERQTGRMKTNKRKKSERPGEIERSPPRLSSTSREF